MLGAPCKAACIQNTRWVGRGFPCLGAPTVRSLTPVSAGSSTVFSQTPILQALQHVQASCDEAHKMK